MADFITALPEELIAKIFSYLSDGTSAITAAQVCTFFKLVANTQIRSIDLKLRSEKNSEIKSLQDALAEFRALKRLKLELSFDVNNLQKSTFCARFSEQLTHLSLREMTFLNPFFDPYVSFNNLTSLTIQNSDLTTCCMTQSSTSSSSQISHFILFSCPKLKDVTISGCSGLEIESLNNIGQHLGQTSIENFQLLPTYSYFDVAHSSSPEHHWTIEKLKTFSIRSKLVVMKKNFVRNLIARRNESLMTLELIAELDLGEPLVPKIIQNYPNLEKLSIGKGCTIVRNDDFSNLCNFYKRLRSFEFHFGASDNALDLRGLQKNDSITELTLGLTKNITIGNVTQIAKSLPNVSRLNIILYFLSTSNQDFLTLVTQVFKNVQHIEFQRTGMHENIKFTAIKSDSDATNLRHFDDIKNLTN